MYEDGTGLPDGLALATSPDPALWALEGMSDDPEPRYILWDYMPAGFDRYVRVFHPLRDRGGNQRALRWQDVAARSPRIGPATRLVDITGRAQLDEGWLDEFGPLEGSLSERALAALLDLLLPYTATPDDLWMAFWDGWGGRWSEFAGGRTVFERPFGRRYVLLRGDLKEANAFTGRHSPQLWWPHDRAWFVSTEIDSVSTYVGGSDACAAELLSAGSVETIEVPLDVRVDGGPR